MKSTITQWIGTSCNGENGGNSVSRARPSTSNNGTLSHDLAMDLLMEHMKIEGGRLNLKNKYVNEFRRLFPAKKVVRFFQVDNKLDAIVV